MTPRSHNLRRKLSSSLSSVTAPPSKSLRRETKPSQKLRENLEAVSETDMRLGKNRSYGKTASEGQKTLSNIRPRRVEY